MPRKLPKTATKQFMELLDEYENAAVALGEGGSENVMKRVGQLRNKLIKMFESKGT